MKYSQNYSKKYSTLQMPQQKVDHDSLSLQPVFNPKKKLTTALHHLRSTKGCLDLFYYRLSVNPSVGKSSAIKHLRRK